MVIEDRVHVCTYTATPEDTRSKQLQNLKRRSVCDLPRTNPTQRKKLVFKKREATSRMQFSKAWGGMRGKNDERTNAAAAAAL